MRWLVSAPPIAAIVGVGTRWPVRATRDIFTDATEAAGIRWQHVNGESEEKFLVEAVGGGVAFFDFDRDGLQDLFFVTGGETPRSPHGTPPRNALYRNLGKGKFADVAAKAGLERL
jgi:hypothetical protein